MARCFTLSRADRHLVVARRRDAKYRLCRSVG
jgi:hypothetical protein